MKGKDARSPEWEPSAGDIGLMSAEGLCFIAQIVLCVFFFDFLRLNWLMYLGGAMLAFAVVLAWRSRVAFEAKGEARKEESWLRTTKVVDTDIYALVRHPMYLSFFLTSLALVLFSQHWLNAVLGAVVMGLFYNDMRREDKIDVARFGDDYVRYMERVPRMNFVLGAVRLLRRSRQGGAPPARR